MSLKSRFIPYIREFGIGAAFSRSLIEAKKFKQKSFHKKDIFEWDSLFELNPEVLVVSNDMQSPSHLYRVENTVAAFWMIGKNAAWVNRSTFKSLQALPRNTRIVILWRTSEKLDAYPCIGDRNDVHFIYDIDDLTFEPSAYNIEQVDGLRHIPNSVAQSLVGPVLESQRNLINQVDLFTAPTSLLIESAMKLNPNVSLWPNVLSQSDLESSNKLFFPKKDSTKEQLTIGYASGSKTHNADFNFIARPLHDYLRQNPKANLEILGLLDLPSVLQEFKSNGRIIMKPLVEPKMLLEAIKDWDINLAPLCLPNEFNNAKSELKWIHAGILGIPTIASASQSFTEVITDGTTGFLASNESDWSNALQELSRKETRQLVGFNARAKIIESRTIGALASAISQTLEKIDLSSNKSQSPSIKTIAWVLPNLPTGSGGHRNVFRLANSAGNLGYKSIVVIRDTHLGNKVDDFARKNYGDGNFRVTENLDNIGQADFVVATHHSTVNLVLSKAGTNSKLGYVVQDFEPWFYPMGQQYLEALETYNEHSLNVICSGRWMAEKVKELKGKVVPFFEFPLDRQIYYPDTRFNQGIVFFAKPDTPRRLFDLGIDSLRLVRKVLPTTRISLFGSNENQLVNFRGEFEIIGKLPTIQEVGELYRDHQVGLAFSTSNPSLVPIEMMACGLPVVDVTNEVTKVFYPKWMSENLLAEIKSNDIASKLIALLCNEEFRNASRHEGISFAETFPTTEMMDPIVKDWIVNAK